MTNLEKIKQDFIKKNRNKFWGRRFRDWFFWIELKDCWILVGYLPALIVKKEVKR